MPRSRASLVLAVLVLWTAVALLSSAANLLFSLPMEQAASPGLTLAFQLASWSPWAVVTPFVFWLTRRYPMPRFLALHLAASMVAALLHLAVVAAVGRWIFVEASPEATWSYIFRMWLGTRLIISVMTYWLITGAALSFDYYRQWRGQEVRTTALEAELARAELASLRMQLQPHFLFNALHAINVLIREDPAAAGRAVVGLGELLRASLNDTTDQEVTLAEERALTERYLAIESIRFQDRLRLEVAMPPELDRVRVPHFLLQPLVENAFKHGLSQSPDAGVLRLAAHREEDRLVLEVANDGPAPAADAVDGVGLGATRRRLAHLYGTRAELHLLAGEGGRGAVARITLPLTT
jgi:hypothetical protein